jgi:hypothetical protein
MTSNSDGGSASSSGVAAIPGIRVVMVSPSCRAASSTVGVRPARVVTPKGRLSASTSLRASSSCSAALSVSAHTPLNAASGNVGKTMKV